VAAPDVPQSHPTDAGPDVTTSDVPRDIPQESAAETGAVDTGEPRTDTGEPRTDTGGFPPGCYRCVGGTTCRDGIVTDTPNAPVLCDFFTGSCPAPTIYKCKEGCAIEPTDIHPPSLNGYPYGPNPFAGADAAALAALCKETPSKTAGAPCDSTPSSCEPNRAQDQPDGGLHTEHLACKDAICQPTALPEHFYTPCSAFTFTGDGFVKSDQCPYCLAYKDVAGGCIRTGCTGPCWSDHECPQGSFCDETIVNLSQPSEKTPLCRPGPRKGLPQGLTCMIGPRDR